MNLDELSNDKKEVIERFRERVRDCLNPEKDNDYYLSTWLIARNFNVDKAEAMFRKHIHFMKVNGLDKMEDYVPSKVTDYFLTKLLGYDKDGSIVRYLHIGASDLRGLTFSLSTAEAIKYAVYILRNDVKTQQEERKNDKICLKQVYIFNLNGLNWRSVIHRTVVRKAFTLLKTYENNYPETLKIVYIVNAPSFFNFIYNWLTTVLPASILDKVHVVSPANVKDELTKNIDPSILPACISGTLVDENGDPECPSMFKMPLHSTVPEDLLPFNQFSVLENDPLAQKVVIEKGCFFKVEKIITEPNSSLVWDFKTVGYDISLGLFFKENANTVGKEIIPLHRVDSHLFPESGNFLCSDPGIYVLVFDNTFSWFTRKEVTYKVDIELPDKNTES